MSDQGGFIKAETAAKLLMITQRHLTRLVADGWIKKTDGKFTVVGTVQGFIHYKNDENRRNSQKSASSKAADARAREIELRIARQERQLIPLEEAVASMNFAVGAMRAELEGSAANITRDRELRNRIQDAHDGILKRASQRVEREAAALRRGSNAAAAVGEDDSGSMGGE